MEGIEDFQNLEGSEEAFGAVLGFIIIILLVVLVTGLAIYIVTSIFMNRLHKRIYGNGTALAWIPFARTYLLGKLAFNKLVGIIYLAVSIISGLTASTGADGETTALVPGLSGLVSVATIVLYVFALLKNGKLKRGELTPEAAKAECESMNFKKQEVAPTQPKPVPTADTLQQGATPEAQVVEQGTPAPAATPKFCSNCGAEIIEGSAFCANCGNKN